MRSAQPPEFLLWEHPGLAKVYHWSLGIEMACLALAIWLLIGAYSRWREGGESEPWRLPALLTSVVVLFLAFCGRQVSSPDLSDAVRLSLGTYYGGLFLILLTGILATMYSGVWPFFAFVFVSVSTIVGEFFIDHPEAWAFLLSLPNSRRVAAILTFLGAVRTLCWVLERLYKVARAIFSINAECLR